MRVLNKLLHYCLIGMLLFSNYCLAFNVALNAPVRADMPTKYQVPSIKKYGAKDGLSQVSVYDIAQDKNGYIWVATQSGIDKFDGYTFTNFRQSDEPGKGLSGSLVYSIELEPKSGDLWIGTINGLDVLRSSKQSFEKIELRTKDKQLDKDVQTILIDENSNIFVGTGKGLYLQKSDQIGFVSIEREDAQATLHDIVSQYGKRLLLATENGVVSYDLASGQWEKELLNGVKTTALELDSEGYLWVGTANQGIYRAQVRGNNFANLVNVNTQTGFSDNIINDIKQMEDGSIWVATTNGASIFPNPNDLVFINTSSQSNNANSSSDGINNLFNTNTGLIFFGTNTEGFGVLDLNSTMFGRLDLGPNQYSYFLTQQADDTLWITTKAGVLRLNPDFSVDGPWKHAVAKDSVNKMTSLDFDERTQSVWVASRLGVGRLKPGSEVIESIGLDDTAVYAVKIGPNGHLWIGTRYQGLIIFDVDKNEIIKRYDIPMATNIYPESADRVLLATINGLYIVNPSADKVRRFVKDPTDDDSLAHDVLTWVSKRDDTSYYVGSQGHGLQILELKNVDDKPKFSQAFSNETLNKASIGAVIDDKRGKLWISTEKYIISVHIDSGVVDIFDENDGVNATGYYVGANAVKQDGTIMFAGDGGVTYFHPEEIHKPNIMPDLQFTRVAILNSQDGHGLEEKFGIVKNLTDSVTKVVLSPDDILLSIEFAALEFGSAASIDYAYRLIGFDDRWQKLDSKNRAVTYTNLDPGSYIFEVRSTNRYGIWNDKPQRMPILVTPPWWQTSWAFIIFGLFTIIVIFVIFRWRTYALHMRSKMLLQSVQEKTVELQLANEQLTLLTTLDPLTQVYNRRGFTDAVSKEFSKYKRGGESFSIILIDIDFFKRINDDYGHEAGDHVLMTFARLLQDGTRDYDILARWGGEEFIVLLPKTQLKDAINIANKYRDIIRKEAFSIHSGSLRISLTAGVANIEDFASVDECIKRADSLLYEGKRLGRDQVLPML